MLVRSTTSPAGELFARPLLLPVAVRAPGGVGRVVQAVVLSVGGQK